MSKFLIWDLPLRLFHWVFAWCLSLALLLAFLVDDDNPLFRWHMVLGLVAALLLLVRVAVGMAGGQHSRLRGLFFSPSETMNYLIRAPFGKAQRYAGHNPGTALAALGMFVLVSGQAWSGWSLTSSESFEDLHAFMAYGLLAAIAAHLTGLMMHTIHHREHIAFSMLNGYKEAPPEAALTTSRPVAGIVILALATLCFILPFRGYDPASATMTLPFIGTVVLGESESDDHHGEDAGERGHDDDD